MHTNRGKLFGLCSAAAAIGLSCGIVLSLSFKYAQTRKTLRVSSADAGDAERLLVFASNTGLVVTFVKEENTGQFDEIVSKIRDALDSTQFGSRRLSADEWTVLRSDKPVGGMFVYVFSIRAAVESGDFSVSSLLSEAHPSDARRLLEKFDNAVEHQLLTTALRRDGAQDP